MAVAAVAIARRAPRTGRAAPVHTASERNPLGLPSAALLAALLVAMAIAARFVMETWPVLGLHTLAVVAGFSEIEAFVIALLSLVYLML